MFIHQLYFIEKAFLFKVVNPYQVNSNLSKTQATEKLGNREGGRRKGEYFLLKFTLVIGFKDNLFELRYYT